MPLSRRSVMMIAPPAVAALATRPTRAARSTFGQDRGRLPGRATPEATSVTVQSDPAALLDALLAAPVTTPLFPSDTAEITVVEWIDDSDSDLDQAVGGAILQTGEDDNGNFMGPGVYIVHESPDAARAVFDAQLADNDSVFTESILGYSGVVSRSPGEAKPPAADIAPEDSTGSSLIAIVAGMVIVSAIGEGGDQAANDVRALANLAGMLDHLRTVRASETATPVTG